MNSPTNTISHALTKEFGLPCKVNCVGSYVTLRIDDPEGTVTVAVASDVHGRAALLMRDAGMIKQTYGHQWGYHMGAVMMNWDHP